MWRVQPGWLLQAVKGCSVSICNGFSCHTAPYSINTTYQCSKSFSLCTRFAKILLLWGMLHKVACCQAYLADPDTACLHLLMVVCLLLTLRHMQDVGWGPLRGLPLMWTVHVIRSSDIDFNCAAVACLLWHIPVVSCYFWHTLQELHCLHQVL
jgi:hypothetical protein